MSASCEQSSGHTVIAGYGLPGRAIADLLRARELPFCVIELNPETVDRCENGPVPIIAGSCTDPETLMRAGIDRAATFIIAIPDERAALEATAQARRLNASVRIVTRCHYLSAGIEAKARGADEVIVAEQVVAGELLRRIEADLGQRT